MSGTFVLQDWTTVRGTLSTPVTQAERDWLDLGACQDLMLWLEVAELTAAAAGPYLYYQTSPVRDARLFATIKQITLTASATPQLTKVLLSESPSVPLARWVRWKIASADVGTWDVTFRITALALGQGQ